MFFVLKFDCLNIFYQNVRGLRTKTLEFYRRLCCSDFDIIILTETWLCDGVLNTELFDQRYTVHRRDRAHSLKKDGGGILIAIRKSINSKRLLVWESTAEDIWVTLDVKNENSVEKYALCTVYLPPPVTRVSLENFLDNCNRVFECCDMQRLIVGDFNLGCIDWNLVGEASCCLTSLAQTLVDFHFINNFKQLNRIVNNSDRILDLVLTDIQNCEVRKCSDPLSKVDPLHPPLVIKIPSDHITSLPKNPDCQRLNFRKANYDDINVALNEVDWTSLFGKCEDVNQMVSCFHQNLDRIIEGHVPQFSNKHTTKYPPWYTRTLISRLREKEKVRIKVKRYNNPLDVIELKLLKKRCARLSVDCYNQYIRKVESHVNQNPKYFWSFIKSRKNNCNGLPAVMVDNEGSSSDGTTICNMFGAFFASASASSLSKNVLGSRGGDCNDSFSRTEIVYDDLLNKLEVLDESKGPGPDGIPPFFIKRCSKSLVSPLLSIFNASLTSGVFPTHWKVAKVVPVFKNGDNTAVKNYRPISILSCFGKILESIVCSRIQCYFKQHISIHQHGFVHARSTTTNLVTFIEEVVDAMDRGGQIHVIYTDFRKAFDTVPHCVLVSKLASYGISGALLSWIESYLQNRSFFVVANGYKSSTYSITSGVPQGSHLGPVLFNIFVNDIPEYFKYSKPFLYADDLKVLKVVNTIRDSEQLQKDLDHMAEWCRLNGMHLNTEKCFYINFTRKVSGLLSYPYSIENSPLTEVDTVRDLGILLDRKLTFVPHIDGLVARASKTLGFVLRNIKIFKSYKTKILIYNCLVRSMLEYGSIVWRPHYANHILRIERIQKRFLWHLTFAEGEAKVIRSYDARLKRFGIGNLDRRRDLLDLAFLFKIFRNMVNCPQLLSKFNFKIPHRFPRYKIKNILSAPRRKTRLGAYSPVPRLCNLYNKLSDYLDVHLDSIHKFKRCILINNTT